MVSGERFMLWVVCGESFMGGWYVERVLCDGRYVVKFYVMGGIW